MIIGDFSCKKKHNMIKMKMIMKLKRITNDENKMTLLKS